MLSTAIYHRTCFIRSATRRLVFGQFFGPKVKNTTGQSVGLIWQTVNQPVLVKTADQTKHLISFK